MAEDANSIFQEVLCNRTLHTADEVVSAVKEFARLTGTKFCTRRSQKSARGVRTKLFFACSHCRSARPNGKGTECPAFFQLKMSGSSFVVKKPYILEHNHPMDTDVEEASPNYVELYDFFKAQSLNCFEDACCVVRDYETMTGHRFWKTIKRNDSGDVRRATFSCIRFGPPNSQRPQGCGCQAKFVLVLNDQDVFDLQARRNFHHNHEPIGSNSYPSDIKPAVSALEVSNDSPDVGGFKLPVQHDSQTAYVDLTEEFFEKVGRRRCPTREEFELRIQRFQEVTGTVLQRRWVRASSGRTYWYCSRTGRTRKSSCIQVRIRAYKPRRRPYPKIECPFRFVSKENDDGSVTVTRHRLIHNHAVQPLQFQWNHSERQMRNTEIKPHTVDHGLSQQQELYLLKLLGTFSTLGELQEYIYHSFNLELSREDIRRIRSKYKDGIPLQPPEDQQQSSVQHSTLVKWSEDFQTLKEPTATTTSSRDRLAELTDVLTGIMSVSCELDEDSFDHTVSNLRQFLDQLREHGRVITMANYAPTTSHLVPSGQKHSLAPTDSSSDTDTRSQLPAIPRRTLTVKCSTGITSLHTSCYANGSDIFVCPAQDNGNKSGSRKRVEVTKPALILEDIVTSPVINYHHK